MNRSGLRGGRPSESENAYLSIYRPPTRSRCFCSVVGAEARSDIQQPFRYPDVRAKPAEGDRAPPLASLHTGHQRTAVGKETVRRRAQADRGWLYGLHGLCSPDGGVQHR